MKQKSLVALYLLCMSGCEMQNERIEREYVEQLELDKDKGLKTTQHGHVTMTWGEDFPKDQEKEKKPAPRQKKESKKPV